MSEPVTLRRWTDVVRRARLGRTVKAVALVLATYADADGSRVYPGIARLAWECEINYNTAQKALASLRQVHLIELVRAAGTAGARRNEADEYRLTYGPDVTAEVPTPAQAELAVNEIRRCKRGKFRDGSHPTAMGAIDGRSHPSARGAIEGSSHPSGVGAMEPIAPNGAMRSHPTGMGATTHDRDTTTTSHCDQDEIAAVTVSRADEREPPDADVIDLAERKAEREADAIAAAAAKLSPTRCREHGLPSGRCTFCRRASGASP